MYKIIIILVFCLIASHATTANADNNVSVFSFVTGNNWIGKDMVMQRSYVTGVVDGMNAVSALNFNKESFFSCSLKGKSTEQLRAIVDKFIKENPEQWHLPMSLLIFDAINESCSK